MTVRILLAAIAAGLIAGFLMTPVQTSKVVPLIMAAEAYEGGGGHSHDAAAPAADHMFTKTVRPHTPTINPLLRLPKPDTNMLPLRRKRKKPCSSAGSSTRCWPTWSPARVLPCCWLASRWLPGINVTFSTGIAWGFAGWLCVQLLPALGLPPELPGFPYADLTERQIWWAATVALSVMGLWFFTLYKSQWFRALGTRPVDCPACLWRTAAGGYFQRRARLSRLAVCRGNAGHFTFHVAGDGACAWLPLGPNGKGGLNHVRSVHPCPRRRALRQVRVR